MQKLSPLISLIDVFSFSLLPLSIYISLSLFPILTSLSSLSLIREQELHTLKSKEQVP